MVSGLAGHNPFDFRLGSPLIQGGGSILKFGAVAIIIGDSNAAGSAQTANENAFAASYVPDPKIRTVNAAGALVTWTPNVHCGLRSLANSGRPGYEAGFVQRWKQDFPNDPLVILRFGNPGAHASRGPTTGTITGSFSGNQVTRTAGVALTTTQLLRGAGLVGPNGRGIHTLFQNGGNADNWYVGEVRNAANINLGTIASFTFDTYNAFLSWSLTEGDVYNGLSNNPAGGVRARVSAALAALATEGYNPRVVAVGNWIGANDAATTEAAGLYQAAVPELYADMRTVWSLDADCPFVMPKIRSGTNMATIAAAQTALAAADDKIILTETSGYALHDGTHVDMPALLSVGADMFNAVKQHILGMGAGAPRTFDTGGPERVVNGEFPTDINDWIDGGTNGSALSWASGALRTTNTSSTSRARQAPPTDIGKRYAFAVQNVGSPSVAGAVSLGTAAGGTQYSADLKGGSTNPAIAQRLAIAEFVATATAAHIQMALGVPGSLDWDHVTLRELIATQFLSGRIFEDDFAVDGPVIGRLTPDLLPWRLIQTTNGAQVVPEVVGGKMVITPNASGPSASYPYLDFNNGKAAGIHCDLSWTGPGSMAMISARKSGSRLLISDIVRDAFHPTFTETQLDIGVGTGSSVTVLESIPYSNYGPSVVTDGRVYPGVGFTLNGTKATFTLPNGAVIERTDSRFVAGECGVAEHFHLTPPTGGIANEKVAFLLG